MEEPKKDICKRCGEVIYGLSKKDLKYKMLLHSIKHKKRKNNGGFNGRNKKAK